MLMADTVMDADEPRFQIGEDEMDDRQIVLGNLWVAALGNGKVFIPALAEAGISTPIVSDGQRPRSNGALHEPTKRVGAPIGYYGEPDTPGIASVLSLVLRGSRFPMTNLDGTSESYVRKLVTELSGGVFGYLDSVLERHSFDEFGELI